jgi:hypothetical protein
MRLPLLKINLKIKILGKYFTLEPQSEYYMGMLPDSYMAITFYSVLIKVTCVRRKLVPVAKILCRR